MGGWLRREARRRGYSRWPPQYRVCWASLELARRRFRARDGDAAPPRHRPGRPQPLVPDTAYRAAGNLKGGKCFYYVQVVYCLLYDGGLLPPGPNGSYGPVNTSISIIRNPTLKVNA